MANIIMRPATAGALAAQAENIPLQPQHASQIITAGVLGNGVSRFEEASRDNIPFTLQAPRKHQDASLMPQRHQLNERLMAEKAEQIILRINSKLGVVDDNITLQFKALSVVQHLKQQVLDHGFHVYSQKLLFDASRPLADRMKLLKAMSVEDFKPRRATVAIATGRMPPLPAYTVAEFVRSLDNTWRALSFSVHEGLIGWIESEKPLLVEFPLPNLEAGDAARLDHYNSSSYSDDAYLGLGFFLMSFDEKRNRFYTVTPTLLARRLNDGSASPVSYTKQYEYKSYTLVSRQHGQLVDLMRESGRNKLVQLEVCSKCRTVHSKDRADLTHASC
jgi:hypothetical protein